MVSSSELNFPNFRQVRDAILAAPPTPVGFPLEALRDAETLQNLRSASHLQAYLSDLQLEADRAQATPLEPLTFSLFQLFETTGDRAAFERVYFDRRRRMAGLVLTTVVDATDDYLSTVNDLIWEICSEYTWSLPAHLPVGIDQVRGSRVSPEQTVDLFAAHTAHMLAEVLSLLGERLPEWLHYRVRSEIERRIFQPVFYDPHHFWWESAAMNWASVCGGCVGMAALILVEDREQLAGMIDRVIRTMECFLDGFGVDGGCPEGIGYWIYGFGFFTYFAEMLRDFTAGKLDLLQSQRVRQIWAFPGAISLGNSQFVNFSDAREKVAIHPGLGSRLTERLQQPMPELKAPDFYTDHIFRWGHLTRDLLWTDANMLDQPVNEGSFYFDDLAWVIDRRLFNGFSLAFAAKGGHNDEPHNHNDLGHFIVHIGGTSLLADLGAGVYTRDYFQEARYSFLHTGSQGHSVPIINGMTQKDGSDHRAVPLRYERKSSGLIFSLDLSCAYDDPSLKSFVRQFEWSVDEPNQAATLQLTDRFDFGDSFGAVTECFISLVSPQIEENTILWTSAHGRLTMQFDPKLFAAEVQSFETQTHHGEDITVYRLQLSARQSIRSQTISFLLQAE